MRGYAAIGLINPKTPSISVRPAALLVATMLLLLQFPERDSNAHQRTFKSNGDTTPVIECASIMDAIPYDCVPVAVDLIEGAMPLTLTRTQSAPSTSSARGLNHRQGCS